MIRISILTIVLLGSSGCSLIDEYLLKPEVTLEDGSKMELSSKAEEFVDKYDDTAALVIPIDYKWTIPVIVSLVAIASTVATRVLRKNEDDLGLSKSQNKEESNG